MGMIFVRMPKIWQSFEENRYISLLLAVMSYGILLSLFLLPKEFIPTELIPVNSAVAWEYTSILVKWSWITCIIGFAKRYLNHTNNKLKYCNSIVYPFFILHQTIIIIIGFYVIDWGMSGPLEYLTIVIGTFVICGLLYELLIKKVNILRLLFGLSWQKKSQKINSEYYSRELITK